MERASKHPDNKPSRGRRVLAGAAAAVAGSVALAACSNNPAALPEGKFKAEAIANYDKTYETASPAGKFVLQYVERDTFEAQKYPTAGQGIGGYWTGLKAKINNSCLFNTAYDIAGGNIKGSFSVGGLFVYGSGSVSGNNPTAAAYAEVNPKNPNQLFVQSGHTDSVELTFDGLQQGDELTPADPQTKDILYTYGCEVGITSVQTDPNYLPD